MNILNRLSKKPIKKIIVQFDRFDQNIFIGNSLEELLVRDLKLRNYKTIFPIVDQNVSRIYKTKLQKIFDDLQIGDVIEISPIESSKSIGKIIGLLETLYEGGLNRKGCILGIGGGITGDLAGFISSIYMRGVDYVYYPTTTMSQCDSVIGKVGVGHKAIKNLLGSFYSPTLTYCDISFIKSQNKNAARIGLSEIIKSAVVASPGFTRYLEKLGNFHDEDIDYLPWTNIIYESLSIKRKLVERDQYDNLGLQKGLSYGHTIANVLEGSSLFHLHHGEAITLGMRIAGEISTKLGILSKNDLERQNNLLNSYGLIKLIPFKVNPDKIIQMLKQDKLSMTGSVDLILLEKIGKFRIQRSISESIVRQALEKYSVN